MNRQLTRFQKRLPHLRVDGGRVISHTRHLIRQGNDRHLVVRNRRGRTLVEVPLNVGVLAAALAPGWTALGTVAALATDCSILVEKHRPDRLVEEDR